MPAPSDAADAAHSDASASARASASGGISIRAGASGPGALGWDYQANQNEIIAQVGMAVSGQYSSR